MEKGSLVCFHKYPEEFLPCLTRRLTRSSLEMSKLVLIAIAQGGWRLLVLKQSPGVKAETPAFSWRALPL